VAANLLSAPSPLSPPSLPPPSTSQALNALYTQLDEARRSAAASQARVDILERSLAVVSGGSGGGSSGNGGPALPPPPLSLSPTLPDASASDPAGLFGAGDTALVPRAALELLKLKDLAMDSVVEGITIADASLPDMPLIYANRAFARITGYSVADTLGKNCRFLQGPGTDAEEVALLRAAVKGGRPCVVQLLNYRRNGE